ncbi:MAG: hypothetical protein KKD01_00155 [Proteobacteria bacterium]|nr:hypothetical protein [Pseudomonadota bacterium]MBU1417545.1 hypothetical protein [Pseudomonadota bacterium]MBU1453108.1 hypothetical protein [Pseudomonadota bacterium]
MKNDTPELDIIDYSDLPDGDWNPKLVSNTQNAMGVSPLSIMYLWIFERPDSLYGQLIAHGWAFLGPVHLLVSPSARVDSPVLRTHHDIETAVKQFHNEAGKQTCPKFIDYEYRASYFGYPINYLWCTDKTWEYGFRLMAGRSQYFVIDLTTDERPEGLLTEINHVFNTIPLRNVIFLIDTSRANIDLIRELLYSVWNSLAPGSVNFDKGETFPPIISYKSSNPGYLAKATLSLWTGKSKVPIARRAANFFGWGQGEKNDSNA